MMEIIMTRTPNSTKNPNWTPQETRLAYAYVGLMDFTLMNIGNALRCAQRLSGANSPSEFEDAVTDNARDQFEALSNQIERISAFIASDAEDMKLTFWE